MCWIFLGSVDREIDDSATDDSLTPGAQELVSPPPPLKLNRHCEVSGKPLASLCRSSGGDSNEQKMYPSIMSSRRDCAWDAVKEGALSAFDHAGQGAWVDLGRGSRYVLYVDCVVRGFRVDILVVPRAHVSSSRLRGLHQE